MPKNTLRNASWQVATTTQGDRGSELPVERTDVAPLLRHAVTPFFAARSFRRVAWVLPTHPLSAPFVRQPGVTNMHTALLLLAGKRPV
jgi:hypothetical protein